jgi:DNA-binding MarR family transcriptional regulator
MKAEPTAVGEPRPEEYALPQPTRRDFENALAFRIGLRRFLHWSEQQSRAVGLTPVQHQLLVAIKGHPGDMSPTISEVADYLMLRLHSVVGLVDRAEAAGFVRRCPDGRDGRVVRLELTEEGDRVVNDLTHVHLAEMHKLAAVLNILATGEYLTHPGIRGPARSSD